MEYLETMGKSKFTISTLTYIFYLILVMISLSSCNTGGKNDQLLIPLQRGNLWKYQGNYNGKPVSCCMEVHDILKKGNLTFALMKGFPTDVMEGENWEPSVWGLLAVGNEHYYKVSGNRIDSIDQKLSDNGNVQSGLVNDSDIFLEALYGTGQTFGEAAQLTRDDGNYFWKVTGKQAFEPSAVRGLKLMGPFDSYSLTYKTVADETIMDVVPGIGIVRYRYSHHGTPAELDMKLAETGIQ